jgi:hypothetical protein
VRYDHKQNVVEVWLPKGNADVRFKREDNADVRIKQEGDGRVKGDSVDKETKPDKGALR